MGELPEHRLASIGPRARLSVGRRRSELPRRRHFALCSGFPVKRHQPPTFAELGCGPKSRVGYATRGDSLPINDSPHTTTQASAIETAKDKAWRLAFLIASEVFEWIPGVRMALMAWPGVTPCIRAARSAPRPGQVDRQLFAPPPFDV